MAHPSHGHSQGPSRVDRETVTDPDRDPAIDPESDEVLRASYVAAQEQAERVSDDLGRWVRRSPGQAVLAGLALGFAIGLLFRGGDEPRGRSGR